jgi:hypothetical protein
MGLETVFGRNFILIPPVAELNIENTGPDISAVVVENSEGREWQYASQRNRQ